MGVLRHRASATIEPMSAGTLFLRVNDRWNELSDNSGQYEVRVTLNRPSSECSFSCPLSPALSFCSRLESIAGAREKELCPPQARFG